MRRVKTKTVHLFSGGRDKGEGTPNFHYLALFVYQLMEIRGWDKGEGRGSKAVELLRPYYNQSPI
jgi:hypothetical protein